ncbi:Ethanolamine ammonia-lyase heavy chain [Posidoniimonas corsicana]|uniref:Ethanolamine ammonia-lyase heavy chain n=1 Tax=Posidoniimonas corsicana TaxID=1938618 RepID=A0A5C5VGB3_9BACT|nr:ethanolamine ammonia-lyase subunit EutB [Posidoniimonas corsicana]TWT37606.1 Ethanolamine ammonia-lyase heavy chain [Posidoniimonas corsicana]
MPSRRSFLRQVAGGSAAVAYGAAVPACLSNEGPLEIPAPRQGEDVFSFIHRRHGGHDPRMYAQILGAANEFKEGDQAIGVAASDNRSRIHARRLLGATRLSALDANPIHTDELYRFISLDRPGLGQLLPGQPTLGTLKRFLLVADEASIKEAAPALSSDVIGCVVKLMTNDELIQVGRKVFNPLPGSQLGAKGYLGARVQPNSPTDNVDDIAWQVFDAWSYGVGDMLLGTNPVSSEAASVAAVERTLQDLLQTFGVEQHMPHCVLSHIDVQAEVERTDPGSTALWFQSIAGCDAANATFDISVAKMERHASSRSGRYGLYFETGQGADFTNGHSHGFDMVLHEARKYGFARTLSSQVSAARAASGNEPAAWVHLNDVAGFIGPEVFRTREQLVRCCLEDIVMGKLHGLCIGLDVCSTLHMDVSLEDLDWCLDQILPANPAYLMALPTKIDPMLGYLTTGYHDHVRLREKFGYRVNDAMWAFFQQLGVIESDGRPGGRFGDPLWVYLQYRRRKGDPRADDVVFAEGRRKLAEVRSRGVFIAEGHGDRHGDPPQKLREGVRRIYDDAKLGIWAELDDRFVAEAPDALVLETNSVDRTDYILHPVTGEQLSERSQSTVRSLREHRAGEVDLQIVISDGLNALAIMEPGQLTTFLTALRAALAERDRRVASEHLIVNSGRVRAGYSIGETLFAGLEGRRTILHVIGERPGTGHRTFSTYITSASGEVWGRAGEVDHNITKVVSGIANTALDPTQAAADVARLAKLD